MSNSKTSFLSRSLSIAKLAVEVGVKELKSSDLNSKIEQAKAISKTLSELKGAAMKVGQLLSIDVADYFPEEAAVVLSQLQNSATTEDFEKIKETIISDLGIEKYKKFDYINNSALASASISQIHKGLLENQEIVLKIQHQNVEKSIDSDVAILKKILSLSTLIYGKKIDFSYLFQEIEEVLKNETDFHYEINSLKKFQEKMNSSHLKEDFILPKVYEDYCTKKIITMSFEEGETLNDWIRQKPTIQDRKTVAKLLLDLYCFEFFKIGLVQTDPNFSNFLIRDSKKGIKIILLDFGATKFYDQTFIKSYIELLQALEIGDEKLILEKSYQFGFLNSKESEHAKKLYVEMMNMAIEPFMICKDGKEFDFTSVEYSKRSNQVLKNFIKELKYSAPPHQIVFLHRKLGGLFSLLKKMDLKMNIYCYWEKMVKAD